MQELIIIEAGQQERHYWLDLWRYRELFQVLVWRDLSVRYKQTVFGAVWALIRPFVTMLVFTVVFGRIAQLPSDGSAPYALMVLAGILPWTFFATGLADASYSLVNNANLVHKVHLPWLIVPAATVTVAFVDFLDQLRHSGAAAVVVSVPAGLADAAIAGVRDIRFCREHRSSALDHRSQRTVSRLSLCHSIHCAVWSVCLSSRIQLKSRAGAMAAALFAESEWWGS